MAKCSRQPLGEILVRVGLIDRVQLAAALGEQTALGCRLGSALIRMELVREEDVLRCLSEQLRFSYVDFREIEIPERVLKSVPVEAATKFNVIPVAVQGRKVILAMSDPADLQAIREIEFQIGAGVRPVVATELSIARAIDHYYCGGDGGREACPSEPVPAVPRIGRLGQSNPVDIGDSRGKAEGQELSSLQEFNTLELVGFLIMVLRQKGFINKNDLADALAQIGSSRQVA